MSGSSQRARRVRELFARVHALPPHERASALEAADVDPAEADEVRELLTFDAPEPVPAQAALPEVDGYEVTAEIGGGTSGRVFSAVRRSDGRTVAIKVLRQGAGEDAAKRFSQESLILERLDHPGIARFHGASAARTPLGTAPCIVLDLVEGLPITKHCDLGDLSDSARIELVAELCDAVHHAHERGVVHRDLKPANVLVDDRDRPTVLDFGIARTSGAERFATLARTRDGDLIGTLAYMSPEQARGAQVDAQGDVYSIGVMLFELLTGAHPRVLTGSTVTDAIHRITHEEAQSLIEVRPDQAGDLATIVGRSLERDAGDRYASAAALAADLRRFLANKAIHARPPGTLEQLQRFARRNRGFVAACAAVFVALGVGVAGLGYGVVRARAGEAQAQRSAAVSRRVLDELLAFVQAPGADSAGYNVRVVDELEAFSARTLSAEDLPSDVGLSLHRELGETFADLGATETATRHLEHAVDLARSLGDDGALAELMLDLGGELRTLGSEDSARAALEESRALRVRMHGEDSVETAVADVQIAFYERSVSEFKPAETRAQSALALLEERLGPDTLEVQRARNTLACVWIDQSREVEAIELLEDAMQALGALEDPPLRLVAYVRGNLAVALRGAGRSEEAEAMYRTQLQARIDEYGPRHPQVHSLRRGLGITLKHLQRFEEARLELQAAAEGMETSRSASHRDTLGVKEALAQTLHELGRREEALELQQSIADQWVARGAQRDGAAMNAFNTLAHFHYAEHRFEEAHEWVMRTAQIARAIHGRDNVKCITVDMNVAQSWAKNGRLEEAEALLRDVLLRLQPLARQHPRQLATARGNLGWLQVESGRADEGVSLLEQTVREAELHFLEGELTRIRMRGHLVDTLRQLGRFDEAEAQLEWLRREIRSAKGSYPRDAQRRIDLEEAVRARRSGPIGAAAKNS